MNVNENLNDENLNETETENTNVNEEMQQMKQKIKQDINNCVCSATDFIHNTITKYVQDVFWVYIIATLLPQYITVSGIKDAAEAVFLYNTLYVVVIGIVGSTLIFLITKGDINKTEHLKENGLFVVLIKIINFVCCIATLAFLSNTLDGFTIAPNMLVYIVFYYLTSPEHDKYSDKPEEAQ